MTKKASISWEALDEKMKKLKPADPIIREYKPRYLHPRYNQERFESVGKPGNPEFYVGLD
jgi:hypothetical protein